MNTLKIWLWAALGFLMLYGPMYATYMAVVFIPAYCLLVALVLMPVWAWCFCLFVGLREEAQYNEKQKLRREIALYKACCQPGATDAEILEAMRLVAALNETIEAYY